MSIIRDPNGPDGCAQTPPWEHREPVYAIDDEHGNQLSCGLSGYQVEGAAQAAANRLGRPVYWYEDLRGDDLGDEYDASDEVSNEVHPEGGLRMSDDVREDDCEAPYLGAHERGEE